MRTGGKRPGAGRKPSASTTKTREVAERLAKDGGITPLEYVMRVMRDERASKDLRFEAAKAALPYFHPRMPTLLEHSAPGGGAIQFEKIVVEVVSPK